MTTVQELVQESRLEGYLEGYLEGWQEGRLAALTDHVRLYWGNAEAESFRMRLAEATLDQLPTMAELQGRWQRQDPPLPPENEAIHRNAEKLPGCE